MEEKLIKKYILLAFYHNKKRIRKKYRYKLFEMIHLHVQQVEKQNLAKINDELYYLIG